MTRNYVTYKKFKWYKQISSTLELQLYHTMRPLVKMLRSPSDPRSIPYHSPNSHPNHPLRSQHYATIPPNPDWPPRTLLWYHHPPRSPTNPQDLQLHFNSYYSVLVLCTPVRYRISYCNIYVSFIFLYILLKVY